MTSNPCAIDLTKDTDVSESTRLLFNNPHVPSFKTMRTVVSETSNVLVDQSNLICVVKDRCTTHLNLSVSHLVAEQHTLNLQIIVSCVDRAIECMTGHNA